MSKDEEMGGFLAPLDAIESYYRYQLECILESLPDSIEESLDHIKWRWRKPELIKVYSIWINPPEDI